jgi:hypothetical protein
VAVCPHLDRTGPDPGDAPPRVVPDTANRCLALDDAIRLSADQQRLVCATDRHLTCRRFELAASGAAPTAFVAIRPLLLRPAVLLAILSLVVAFVIAVAYLMQGGSFEVAFGL